MCTYVIPCHKSIHTYNSISGCWHTAVCIAFCCRTAMMIPIITFLCTDQWRECCCSNRMSSATSGFNSSTVMRAPEMENKIVGRCLELDVHNDICSYSYYTYIAHSQGCEKEFSSHSHLVINTTGN